MLPSLGGLISDHLLGNLLTLAKCYRVLLFCQVEYGVLVAAVSLQQDQRQYCIIQELEACVDVSGQPICSEMDCPLLTLADQFYAVSPEHLLTPVSVVHRCTSSCKFGTQSSHRNVEREAVTQTSLVFEHDWSNVNYCLNRFCVNQ